MNRKPNVSRLAGLRRDGQSDPASENLLDSLIESDDATKSEVAEYNMCLDLLKGAAFEDEPVSQDFNDRILRRHKVRKSRRSIAALTPAFIGAAAAAIAFVALLQAVSAPAVLDKPELQNQKAELERIEYPAIPSLNE